MSGRRARFAVAAATLALLLLPGVHAGAADADHLTVTGVDTTRPGTATIAVSVPAGFSDGPLPSSAWTVRESGRSRPVRVAVSNALAFGGSNTCGVVTAP